MKRMILPALLATLISVMAGCGTGTRDKAPGRHLTVILTEPTTGNISTIRYLMENKILDLPDSTRFICVYHPVQASRFDRSERYIERNGLANFRMERVEGELGLKTLFSEGALTPAFRRLFDESDGIIFFGGPDMPPAIYGEENTLSVVTDSGRHYFETAFLFHLLGSSRNEDFRPFLDDRPGYMVTGFCLGMQTMNVAAGGSLYQDIPADIYGLTDAREILAVGNENLHRNYWQKIKKDSLLMSASLHTIRFTAHPFFREAVGVPADMEPFIYSSHHQSVKELGKGFEVTALSPDGKVIEGIAHSTYPNVFAVQFHPEVTSLYEDRELRKFAPDDKPFTYHQRVAGESLVFHKAYWKHISDALKN